jgi:hypothetical protein
MDLLHSLLISNSSSLSTKFLVFDRVFKVGIYRRGNSIWLSYERHMVDA